MISDAAEDDHLMREIVKDLRKPPTLPTVSPEPHARGSGWVEPAPLLTKVLAMSMQSATNCPFRSPGGPPLPLAPPCNRQRAFFVAVTRQGFPCPTARV